MSGDDSADNASVNVENLLFGYSLGKHHRANIEVSKHTSRKKSSYVFLVSKLDINVQFLELLFSTFAVLFGLEDPCGLELS